MTLPTEKLKDLLDAINKRLPHVRRISSDCLASNVRGKSAEALSILRSNGLSLVYVGCESGDDVVLSAVKKGETAQTSLERIGKIEGSRDQTLYDDSTWTGWKGTQRKPRNNSAVLCGQAVLTASFP